jgi:hypothetical protein
MNTVKIEILDNVSHSKGWGRYSVTDPSTDAPLITTSTGNRFCSGAAGAGTKQAEMQGPLLVTMQVMLRVGKGYTAREEIKTQKIALIAKDGEVVEVKCKPGSQGIALRITGARLAVTGERPS